MTRKAATVLGFAVAPFAAGVVNAAVGVCIGDGEPFKLLFYFSTALVYAVFLVVIFAVPTYRLLNRIGLVNLWTSVAAGALIGALFGVTLRSPPQASEVMLMASIGTLAALAFWLVWRTGRDDPRFGTPDPQG